MSAETKLLILGSRVELSPSQKSELEKCLNQNLDWNRVIKIANNEGVSPLLYQSFKPFVLRIPDTVVSKLRQMYIRNSARNIYLFHSLKPVLDEVERAGLRAAFIKGARLAETVYKDPGTRFFTDVDLLVDSSHKSKIHKILFELGFVQTPSAQIGRELSTREKMYWTYRPVYRKGKCELELHYNFPGLHMPFSRKDDLWQRIQKIQIEGSPAQVLSPEYELCLLCLHSQQHSYSRLAWFTDIAEMVEKGKLDWDKVLEICRGEGIEAPVYYGLHLVNELWPGTVSQKVLRSFHVSFLEMKLLKFFWPLNSVKSRKLEVMFPMHAPTFFSVLSRKRLGPFVRALYNFFIPPRSWVSFYYGISPHSFKMVIHYLWRFWRPVYLIFRRLAETGR